MKAKNKLGAAAWVIRNVENWGPTVRACAFGRPIDEVRLRRGPRFHLTDGGVGECKAIIEVFWQGIYRTSGRIDPAGTIIDVGANIGSFALYAALRLVPQGRVMALEPNPKCLDRLRRNLRENCIENVFVREGAVGSGVGETIALRTRDGDTVGSTICGGADGGAGTVQVPLVSPKALLRWSGDVQLMKVDCEGGEHALFWQTSADDWRSVKRIALEYHLGLGSGYPSDCDPAQLRARIEAFGFNTELRAARADTGYIVAVRGI